MEYIVDLILAFLDVANPANAQWLALALVFAAVVLVVIGTSQLFFFRGPLLRRIDAREAGKDGPKKQRPKLSLRNAHKTILPESLLQAIQKHPLLDTRAGSVLHRRMAQAGFMNPATGTIYYIARVALAVGLTLGFAILSPYLAADLTMQQELMVAGGFGLVGFYLPWLWITYLINSRRNAARLGFPDALDMLLVCVEAGLSLDSALNRVAQEIKKAHPLLGKQFMLVVLELRAGQTREVALRNLAERLGIDEAGALVTLLVQSEVLGTSIARTLRVHASEMRSQRMLRAEEKANKLPVKLSIPLVMFILPALLLIVMTPAVIQIIRTFGKVN